MFYYFDLEQRIRPDHPLRPIKARVEGALREMTRAFTAAYSPLGRPSIAPEQLLKALMLQALFSIRSERQLVEQIDVNLLFRWFLDLPVDVPTWDATTFTKNRERFEQHGLIQRFFSGVVQQAIAEGLVSEEHFTVDGTLIQAWASLKSLRPLAEADQPVSAGADAADPGNPTVNFRGERRRNATHRSVTDPEARLARKGDGKPALLSHAGHVLMENRHGLCVGVLMTEANGWAERDAVIPLLKQARGAGLTPRTLGLDKGYRAGPFLDRLEATHHVVPHVPMPEGPVRGDGPEAEARRRARRRMRQVGWALSQHIRKRVEEIFGWMKTVGGLARAHHVGRWKIAQVATLVAATYNLIRMARLATAT
ncbi:MAG: IS5 family transposase [Terriglobales bacterium]